MQCADKLAANVTQAKLANDSVGTLQLLNGNVTTAKIADNAVLPTKVNFYTNTAPVDSDNGIQGQIQFSNTFLYVCTFGTGAGDSVWKSVSRLNHHNNK